MGNSTCQSKVSPVHSTQQALMETISSGTHALLLTVSHKGIYCLLILQGPASPTKADAKTGTVAKQISQTSRNIFLLSLVRSCCFSNPTANFLMIIRIPPQHFGNRFTLALLLFIFLLCFFLMSILIFQ